MTARQERQAREQLFMRQVGRLARVIHGVLDFEDQGTPVELAAMASYLASIAVAVATARTRTDLDPDVAHYVTHEAPVLLAKIGALCTALATATTPAAIEAARALFIDWQLGDNDEAVTAPGHGRPS